MTGSGPVQRRKEYALRFLVEARHPPDMCPMANATTRAIARAATVELPGLAEKLGVTITGTYVSRPNHLIVMVVDRADQLPATF